MVAILSDIHANIHALEAVLADMPDVREVWVLGDTIGSGPFPNEAMERLLNLSVPLKMVLGNWEVELNEGRKGHHPEWWKEGNAFAFGSGWTIDNLKPHHWTYLEGLSNTLHIDNVPGGALLYHGSPAKPNGEILDYKAAKGFADSCAERWLFGGHIHRARLYRIGQKRVAAVGSVGMSLDKAGGVAAYTLFDGERLVFRHVAYDVDAAVAAFKASEWRQSIDPGIARAVMATMISGENHVGEFFKFVRRFAEDADMTESIWEEATRAWGVDDWLEERIQ